MPNSRRKKKPSDTTSAEEFSDVDSSLDTDESASDTQDTWTFPVVPHHGKRQEFESVSKLELIGQFLPRTDLTTILGS
jgi:hypothetical protein